MKPRYEVHHVLRVVENEQIVFEWQAAVGNAGGWMHMMCSLKALLEYGINLRAGGAR
jgi:hypothetical protein